MVNRSAGPSPEQVSCITGNVYDERVGDSNIVGKIYDDSVRYKGHPLIYNSTRTYVSTIAVLPQDVQSQQRFLIENRPQLNETVLCKVIPGRDGRRHIENTTDWPYRFHTQLTMIFRDTVYGGSGAMIGAHHVLTCAHNVFDPETGRWADEVLVYPALNEKTAPFGKVKVARVYTYRQWVDHGDRKYDIALLVLSETIGKFTGWGGVLAADDQILQEETVEVTGYPGDKGCNQMWTMDHKLSVIKPEKLYYLIDTYKGQSGSPIWVDKFGAPIIIGVHTSGTNATNIGVRISKSKFLEFIIPIMSGTHELKLPNQLPDGAFGPEKWIATFGDPGFVPPLPADIDQILSAPCPFVQGKRVEETHLLVLIPETVDGNPLTLNLLAKLIQKPKNGHATQFRDVFENIITYYGNTPYSHSEWVLMARDVIRDTENKSIEAQKALIPLAVQGLYTVPTLLEVAVCLLIEHAISGLKLYAEDINHHTYYTRCQEVILDEHQTPRQTVIGHFSDAGLHVGYDGGNFPSVGLAAFRKL